MEAINKISKQIQHQFENVARLDVEIERVERKIGDAEGRDHGLPDLTERRKAVLVDALQNGVKADTSAIDKEIAAAEKRRGADAVAIEKDREAVDLLKSAREQAHDSIATLEAEQIEAVSAYLLAKHDEAQVRYFEAVAALSGPVEQMVSIERAWRAAMPGKAFPARGSKALSDVREGGLRVTWDHSALRRPEVAAEYMDGYQKCWFLPEWADPRNVSFGDAAAQSIASELRSVGVVAVMEVKQAATAPEKSEEVEVEIEVVRGSVSGVMPGSRKRDPHTGQLVSKSLTHIVGDRVMLAQSEAARLVRVGFVRYAADIDAERARQRIEELRGTGKVTVKHFADVE